VGKYIDLTELIALADKIESGEGTEETFEEMRREAKRIGLIMADTVLSTWSGSGSDS